MTLDKKDRESTETQIMTISPEVAREIMGQNNYCGPEAVAKTWGRILRVEEIPPIPFSEEDLKHAVELDQFLILRVNKAGNGRKLSMRNQNALLAGRFRREKKGEVFYFSEEAWRQDRELFTRHTPRPQWALVTKEIIPEEEGKERNSDACMQTFYIIRYVRNKVFKNQELPPEYKLAEEEYFSPLVFNGINILRSRINGDLRLQTGTTYNDVRRELIKRLIALKINQLYRRTPVEALFDCLTYFDNMGHRLLDHNTYDRTMCPFMPNNPFRTETIIIGGFTAKGIDVYFWDPDVHQPGCGVVFSRMR